ncbi:MAG: phage tail protein [Burkholderiales bacterium]|nr:phage tail protein [Burkholderiales bacterium]
MGQPYVGEIRLFAGNFAPAGWALCQGQAMDISENETLFQLIGTTYGGDGQSTFNVPDLRSRVPIHQGQGPGLSTRVIGESGGTETVTLSTQQIPNHTHAFLASQDASTVLNAQGNVIGTPLTATPFFAATPNVALNAQSITAVGGSQPHENMQPYLCINFIISLYGIYPSQN